MRIFTILYLVNLEMHLSYFIHTSACRRKPSVIFYVAAMFSVKILIFGLLKGRFRPTSAPKSPFSEYNVVLTNVILQRYNN